MKTEDVKKYSQLQDLPEEIIYQILIKTPAKYLYNKVRYWGKSWHNLISCSDFIYQNIQHNKPELLISNQLSGWEEVLPGEVKILRIEDDEAARPLDLSLKNFPLRRTGKIRSSCNGLLLVCDPEEKRLLYVMNILTKSWLQLPNCPSLCQHLQCGIALSFDPLTKDYKIVHISSATYGFEIFTLGCSDNSWKRISGPFESMNDLPFNVRWCDWKDPVSVEGQVLHWFVESSRFIISMNASDEKSRKTFLPKCCWETSKHDYDLVEMGGKLALVLKVSETQIDVWILEDFDGQNWVKRQSIMAESIIYRKCKPNFIKLFAVASLRDGEVLVFGHGGAWYATNLLYLYDIKQGKLRKVRTKVKYGCKFVAHRSSLVKWKNERATDSEIIIQSDDDSQDILHGFSFSRINL